LRHFIARDCAIIANKEAIKYSRNCAELREIARNCAELRASELLCNGNGWNVISVDLKIIDGHLIFFNIFKILKFHDTIFWLNCKIHLIKIRYFECIRCRYKANFFFSQITHYVKSDPESKSRLPMPQFSGYHAVYEYHK